MTGAGARNPRYANGAARRRARAEVLAEETHCALCGRVVDTDLGFLPGKHGPRCKKPECSGCSPHPMRPEIDEIVPVSAGGSPILRENLRLTHRACNRQRSDGRPTRPRPVTAPVTPTWSW